MLKRDALEYIEVKNSVASAKIALQGAHIFEYRTQGCKDLLFLSQTSYFKVGKAIRGGIPICWPWFGAHEEDTSLPNHGFARTSLWEHISTEELDATLSKVTMRLESSSETLKLWPYRFELTAEFYIGCELKLILRSQNRDTKPFKLTCALHTYFKIEDIYATRLEGLEGREYFNKCDNTFGNSQKGNIDFTKEVDRIYQRVSSDVCIKDQGQDIVVKSEGTHAVVVWNPGKSLTAKMDDLSDYRTFICVESANVMEDAVVLNEGELHSLRVTITQENR